MGAQVRMRSNMSRLWTREWNFRQRRRFSSVSIVTWASGTPATPPKPVAVLGSFATRAEGRQVCVCVHIWGLYGVQLMYLEV